MNINEIAIYSHTGEIRRVSLKSGLNIITGRSSTGKSTLSDIVEYCMGQSDFNIPEGPIRDKVAWYAVIFQFKNEQVLVAKPTPAKTASSCSKAMIRRGGNVSIPLFDELKPNSDDETVVLLFTELLGIPANETQVPLENSRNAYAVNIKHTFFYLFQKQTLIANKDQLFYRQNDQYIPQTIKDTLPIILGVIPDDQIEINATLRNAKRDLKIARKQLLDANQFNEKLSVRVIALLSEAKQVELLSSTTNPKTTQEALEILSKLTFWKPTPIPSEDTRKISILENEISSLRKDKALLRDRLVALELFTNREEGFLNEALEQKSRLESISAFPKSKKTKQWQWPFALNNVDLTTPIAESLLNEIYSLDKELDKVVGEKPHLSIYAQNLKDSIDNVSRQIKCKEEELAAAIATNSAIMELGSRNAAAAKTIGRISLFLETFSYDDDIITLQNKVDKLDKYVNKLEEKSGNNDSEDRLASILNIISHYISSYIKEMGAEFSEYPFRFDISKLTVIADRPERPIPMNKTGGGANHLAYHLGALLALHYFAAIENKPLPAFLFLDQPTQVYFPSEQIYKAASGSVEDTEKDSDIEKVRNLFSMLHEYTLDHVPGFQIIVTEHANLSDDWFQSAIIEEPWLKPPALVPETWKTKY